MIGTDRTWLGRLRVRCLGVLVTLIPLALPGAIKVGEGKGKDRADFHVGLGSVVFRNVNENDAAAAFAAFLNGSTMPQELGYEFDTFVHIFHQPEHFAKAIRSNGVHLGVVSTWDYLSMDVPASFRPRFVALENGREYRHYLLLCRRDSGIKQLADLRGKSLAVHQTANQGVGRRWLESRVLRENHVRLHRFFEQVRVEKKPSGAILPVFFGGTDVCLVDEAAFTVMQELNPQVGRHLRTIARSPGFVDAVVCITDVGWKKAEGFDYTVKSLRELHQRPAGRQLLTLFKFDQMIPVKPEHLAAVAQLRDDYLRLIKAENSGSSGGGQ